MRELLLVLQGVTVSAGGQELALAAGDAMTFAGDEAHGSTNAGRRGCWERCDDLRPVHKVRRWNDGYRIVVAEVKASYGERRIPEPWT